MHIQQEWVFWKGGGKNHILQLAPCVYTKVSSSHTAEWEATRLKKTKKQNHTAPARKGGIISLLTVSHQYFGSVKWMFMFQRQDWSKLDNFKISHKHDFPVLLICCQLIWTLKIGFYNELIFDRFHCCVEQLKSRGRMEVQWKILFCQSHPFANTFISQLSTAYVKQRTIDQSRSCQMESCVKSGRVLTI